MTRRQLIERIRRQIYGGFPTDDATITDNLANHWISDGLAIAAKQCYTEGIKIDGVGYVNNSFYTTFKGLAVTEDENFLFKINLPEIPVGIGRNEGVQTLQFKSDTNQVSLPCIPISANQKTYFQGLPSISNKILYYPEGKSLYAISTLNLFEYTATVTMISGGDSTDLDSTLNVPPDYIPVIIEYVKQQLLLERAQPVDAANDGQDAVKTI